MLDLNDYDALVESAAITEAYYGKNKTLIECENLFNEIIIHHSKNPLDNINKLTMNSKIEQLLKDLFGVKSFHIYWNSSEFFNARTIINSHLIQSNYELLENGPSYKTDNGYYDFTKTEVIIIQINRGVLNHSGITGAELVAILLHEIGHNFDNNIYRILEFIVATCQHREGIIGSNILASNDMKKHMIDFLTIPDKVIQSVPLLNKTVHILTLILKKSMGYINTFISPLVLATVPLSILMSPLFHTMNIFTAKKEEFSDSFAVAYGYGPELSRVAILFQDNTYNVKDKLVSSPLSKILYDIGVVNQELLVCSIGAHGSAQTRIKKSLDKLYSDLNSSELKPEIKKAIKDDIKRMEEIYEKHISLNEDQKLIVAATVRTLINKAFNGRTDIVAKLLPKNIV